MGMYDTVNVPCPKCGKYHGFKSKSGSCELNEYNMEDVPPDVLEGVNRYAPVTCTQCGTKYHVKFRVSVVSIRSEEWTSEVEEDDDVNT